MNEREEDLMRRYSLTELEKFSYRELQKVAKAMKLPSNVKRIYLIQLIHTNVFGSQSEIQSIIARVRRARSHNSEKKKRRLKNKSQEVSSTNLTGSSPPISYTPKRPPSVRYSPARRITNYPQYRADNRSTTYTHVKAYTYTEVQNNERVLRNRRHQDGLNIYNVNNTIIGVLKAKQKALDDSRMPQVVKSEQYRFREIPEREGVRVIASRDGVSSRTTGLNSSARNPSVPARRAVRKLSGIHPLPAPTTKYRYEIVQGAVTVRNKDGTVSKVGAFVKKPIHNVTTTQTTSTETHPRYEFKNKIRRPIQYQANVTRSSMPKLGAIADIYPRTDGTIHDYKIPKLSTTADIYQPEVTTTYECDNNGIESSRNDFHVPIIGMDIDHPQSEVSTTIDFNQIDSATIYEPRVQTNEITNSQIGSSTDFKPREVPNNEPYHTTYTPSYNVNENQTYMNNTMTYTFNTNMNQENPTPYNQRNSYNDYTDYCYHKKIRAVGAEHVRSRRVFERRDGTDGELPHIHEVFSSFANVSNDFTQPVYVAGDDNNRVLANPYYIPDNYSAAASLLELYYNLKNEYLASVPLPVMKTTCSTHCTYSTPTVATPLVQPAHIYAQYNVNSYQLQSEQPPTRQDYTRNQNFSSSSTTSIETMASQVEDLNSSHMSIGGTVQDAIEMISQDGDYMERIGMDLRIQCPLCAWTSARMLLEQHIVMEHASQIQPIPLEGCARVCVPLRDAAVPLQRRAQPAALYLLQARADSRGLRARLVHTMDSDEPPQKASITIFNKVTGQPFVWQGEVSDLTYSHSGWDEGACFNVRFQDLDIIPNCTNVDVINGSVVCDGKVIEQEDLNVGHIVLYVRIL